MRPRPRAWRSCRRHACWSPSSPVPSCSRTSCRCHPLDCGRCTCRCFRGCRGCRCRFRPRSCCGTGRSRLSAGSSSGVSLLARAAGAVVDPRARRSARHADRAGDPSGVGRVHGRRVAHGAGAARRGRAALPRHHAEPALRRRPEDREQPPARATTARTSAWISSPITCAAGWTARSTPSTRPACPLSCCPRLRLPGIPGVIVFLSIVSALGAALVWRAAWRITGGPAAAWAGWAAVALSARSCSSRSPCIPTDPAAVLVMTGVYALAFPERHRASRWRAAGHGAALAALPWLHTRYAVLAGVLGVPDRVRLWQQARRQRPSSRVRHALGRCLAFLAIPVAQRRGLAVVVLRDLRRAEPRRPIRRTHAEQPRERAARAGGTARSISSSACCRTHRYTSWRSSGSPRCGAARRRLAIELLLVAVPYAVAVACYHMWWGGHSSPARFIVPVLLPFGLAAAAQWARTRSPGRRNVRRAARCEHRARRRARLGGSRCARLQRPRRLCALDGPRGAARQPAARGAHAVQEHRRGHRDAGLDVGGRPRIVSWLVCRWLVRPARGERRTTCLVAGAGVHGDDRRDARVAHRRCGAARERDGAFRRCAARPRFAGRCCGCPLFDARPAARLSPTYRCPPRCAATRGRRAGCLFVGRDLPAGRYG